MEKTSKQAVNYREGRGHKKCRVCAMFKPLATYGYEIGGCTLVMGQIYAGDTCDEWEPKKGSSHDTSTASKSG